MLKLMKLEIKKFKLWNYWKAISICNISFIAFLSMIYFIEIDEQSTDIFASFDVVAGLIGAIVRTTFTIFASVLIVSLIIDEYKKKSMEVMFSYPIKRKRIISAKLIIVFAFTFVNVLFSTLFLEGLVYSADVIYNILPVGDVVIQDILRNVLVAIMDSIATAGISLIPLFVGMHRNSAPATIVTSIFISMFLNSTSGNFTVYSIIAIPISLGLLGLFIAYFSIRNIEKKDLVS